MRWSACSSHTGHTPAALYTLLVCAVSKLCLFNLDDTVSPQFGPLSVFGTVGVLNQSVYFCSTLHFLSIKGEHVVWTEPVWCHTPWVCGVIYTVLHVTLWVGGWGKGGFGWEKVKRRVAWEPVFLKISVTLSLTVMSSSAWWWEKESKSWVKTRQQMSKTRHILVQNQVHSSWNNNISILDGFSV